MDDHQKVKNEALPKLVDSVIRNQKASLDNEIEGQKRLLEVEIEKDRARTKLFSSRGFLIFLMCFPIIISTLVVLLKDEVFFAFLIMIFWYGVAIALYFSQSDALNNLLKNFLKDNADK